MSKAHRNLTDGSRDLARCVPSYIVEAMDHAVRDGEHAVTLHSALSYGSPAHRTSSITRSTLCASAIARGVAVKQDSTCDDGGSTAPPSLRFAAWTSMDTEDSTGCHVPKRATSHPWQRVHSQPPTPSKFGCSLRRARAWASGEIHWHSVSCDGE